MQTGEVPLLLLCGAPGAGKSSVGWEVYWLLMREGVPVAHVDLDGIGYGPPGRSGSFEMKFRNLAALWRSYSGVGASALVVSGLRTRQDDVLACAAAVPGSAPTAVVLTVTAEEQRNGSSPERRAATRCSVAVAHRRRRLKRSKGSWQKRGSNSKTRRTRSRKRSSSTQTVWRSWR